MRIPRQASGRLLIGHMRNLGRNEPHITPAQIARLRTLMETYVGDVIVTQNARQLGMAGRVRLVGPPLSIGERIFFFTANGKIYVFEEK